MEGESPTPNSWSKGELVAWAREGGQKKVQQKYTSDVSWIQNKQRVISLFRGITLVYVQKEMNIERLTVNSRKTQDLKNKENKQVLRKYVI